VIEVRDLEGSVRLYSEAFGLDLHIDDHEGDDRWISGKHAATSWAAGSFLHFAMYASKDGMATNRAQIGFQVDDLRTAYQRAVDAGAEVVHGPTTQPWGQSARFRDFDGNVIELTQRA
jgi:predicted enzyme related to lactoylglutathione lyase